MSNSSYHAGHNTANRSSHETYLFSKVKNQYFKSILLGLSTKYTLPLNKKQF